MEAPSSKNRAFISAWNAGRDARLAGKPITANPYPDHRTYRGSVTFSRAFWRSWKNGWEAADRGDMK